MSGKKAPSKEKTPDEPQSDNDGEEDEEEYEIEAILDVNPDAFEGGKTGYWVKWKNYEDKYNTWVSEEDAGNAQELIDEFWRKRREEKAKDPKKKRGRPSNGDSASAKGSSAKRARKQSSAMDEDEEEGEEEEDPQPKKARSTSTKATSKSTTTTAARKSMAKQQTPSDAVVDILEIGHVVQYKDLKNWDKVVEEITTVERDIETKELYIFFTLNTGERVRAEAAVCRYKFPQKMIDFYESHLKWTESDA